MKWFFSRFILIVFAVLTAATAFAANMCVGLFGSEIQKVIISKELHDQVTDNLRATSPKSSTTVDRSEWKTKLTVEESNTYVLDLMKQFLTAETRSVILKNLDFKSEGFTRKVHMRLFEMQKKGLMREGDSLSVRDKPAPLGATDTTFTYYTNAIKMENGDGKHQPRVRTYLREVEFEKIPVNGEVIQGYEIDTGSFLSFTRVAKNGFTVKVGGEKKNGTETALISEQTLTLSQIKNLYGETGLFYAPHGKSLKLEIKTALEDMILAKELERLVGKHMVQKLDSILTPNQVMALFAPLSNESPKKAYFESMNRLVQLTNQLISEKPENKDRITAVMIVLKYALEKDPYFLTLVGATHYNRTAFETTAGLQTTIDRDQGVYEGSMYGAGALKTPAQTLKNNKRIVPIISDARHVELKVPGPLMQYTVGITYANPMTAPAPQKSPYEIEVKKLIETYHNFVRNSSHAGKFNYIRENGEPDLN